MVSPALRELMVRAPGAGTLAGEGVHTGSAEHPVCGDLVEIDVRLAGDRIEALRWRAQGCPASHAVAAVAGESLPGTPLAQAAAVLRRALAQLGDLGPTERHAERLVLTALQHAAGA